MSSGGGPPDLPAHVTTPLLALIAQRSLDEDYAVAAARRSVAGAEPSGTPRRFTAGTAVIIALFGLLITVVALQTQRDAAVDELSREALIEQVTARRERVSDLQERVRAAEIENQALLQGNAELATEVEAAQRQVQVLGMSAGLIGVQGPGVRMTVRSAEGAAPNDQVRDEDLATLVDGLWQAGAEAISINGERLTATSGIRNTGRSIHVGGRPVSEPYVLSAIGDPDTLPANLLASSQGQVFFELASVLGFSHVTQNVNELRLPAARAESLRFAEPGSDAFRSGTLYREGTTQ